MFVSNAPSVRWFLDRHRTVMAVPPVVWICYPTRGRADFNRGTLLPMLAGHGLHAVARSRSTPRGRRYACARSRRRDARDGGYDPKRIVMSAPIAISATYESSGITISRILVMSRSTGSASAAACSDR